MRVVEAAVSALGEMRGLAAPEAVEMALLDREIRAVQERQIQAAEVVVALAMVVLQQHKVVLAL